MFIYLLPFVLLVVCLVGYKGNVFALVIVGIVVMTVVVTTLQSTPPVPLLTDTNSAQKVIAEVDLSVSEAVSNSMVELMSRGFSKSSNPWFFSTLSLPTADSFEGALEEISRENIKDLLRDLSRRRGYIIDESSIKVDANFPGNPFSGEAVIVRTEVNVSVVDGDQSKEFNISNSQDLWNDGFLIFHKMRDWSERDMNAFALDVARLIDSLGSCQVSQCQCTSAEDAPIITPERIDSNELRLGDFEPLLGNYLSNKVSELNRKFDGKGIFCKFEINDIELDRDLIYQQDCISIGALDLLSKHWCPSSHIRRGDDDNFSIWWAGLEAKHPGKDFNKSPPSGFSVEPQTPVNSYKDCSKDRVPHYTDERIAINPKVYVNVSVVCEKPSVAVNGPTGFEPLSARVSFVTAVKQNCAPSELLQNQQDTSKPGCLGNNSAPIVFCEKNSDCVSEEARNYLNPPAEECNQKPYCKTLCGTYACEKDSLSIPQPMKDLNFGICVVEKECFPENDCEVANCDESSGCTISQKCQPSSNPITCGAKMKCQLKPDGTFDKCVYEDLSLYPGIDCTDLDDLDKCLVGYCYYDPIRSNYECRKTAKLCPTIVGVRYYCEPGTGGQCKPSSVVPE